MRISRIHTLTTAAFAVAATAIATSTLRAAPKVVTLASMLAEKGYTRVPMKRNFNAATVRVVVNGRPLDLVVDTGAYNTVIHSDQGHWIGLELKQTEGGVSGAFGKAKSVEHKGTAKEFSVGAFAAGATPVRVMYMGDQSGMGAKATEGLLGLKFLHDHAAVMDCFGLQLFLKQSSTPAAGLANGLKAGGYTEIPVRTGGGHLYVPVTFGNRTGYMVIDTGAPNTLVDVNAVAGLNYQRFGTRLAFGDIGGNASDITRLKVTDMRVGAFPIPTQEVALSDLSVMRSHAKSVGVGPFFGILGQELLAYYVGIIDCGQLRLFLRLDAVVEAARKRRQS
jgi:predicted aspartyl protease